MDGLTFVVGAINQSPLRNWFWAFG